MSAKKNKYDRYGEALDTARVGLSGPVGGDPDAGTQAAVVNSEAAVADQINEKWDQMQLSLKKAVVRALEIGALLVSAKERVRAEGRQRWTDWLRNANLKMGTRHAQRYMKLAKHRAVVMELLKEKPEASLREVLGLVSPASTEAGPAAGGERREKTVNPRWDMERIRRLRKQYLESGSPPATAEDREYLGGYFAAQKEKVSNRLAELEKHLGVLTARPTKKRKK